MRRFGQVTGIKPSQVAQYKPPHAAGWSGVAGQDFPANYAETRFSELASHLSHSSETATRVAEQAWRVSASNRSRKNGGHCASRCRPYASGVFAASLGRQYLSNFTFVETKCNP